MKLSGLVLDCMRGLGGIAAIAAVGCSGGDAPTPAAGAAMLTPMPPIVAEPPPLAAPVSVTPAVVMTPWPAGQPVVITDPTDDTDDGSQPTRPKPRYWMARCGRG